MIAPVSCRFALCCTLTLLAWGTASSSHVDHLRNLQTAAVDAMPAATNGDGPQDAKPDAAGVAAAGNGAAAPDGQMTPARKRRRRRRRRKPAGDGAAVTNGTGEASESAGEGRSSGRDDASDATPTAA